ncbi:HTTM domain-containing protein [Oerskovia flava]|uniref:HTTM domain-containing protein n=1 Tax=Oerskovia flava TaxID=2986422 RepID=UPI00223F1A46|nr:HTTM domain-containing protein [Oerskovia sp. JB1-3-2]
MSTRQQVTHSLRETVRAGESWMLDSRKASYGVAVLRIGFGAILAVQLAVTWPDRHLAWGAGRSFAQGRVDTDDFPAALDALFSGSSPGVLFDLQYLLLLALAVALMLGWRARLVVPLVLVGYVALVRTNPFIGDGGMQLMRIVLVYLLIADTSGRWSIDARRRERRHPGESRARLGWPGTLLHNTAVLLIAFQIFVVYVASAMYKIQGGLWQHGSAIYYVFQLDEFSTWPEVTAWLSGSGTLITVLTYSAVFVQLFFPFLLLRRGTRVVALVAITGMHLGIGLLMGLMYFSLTMIAIDAIFVRDVTYVTVSTRVARWWRERRARRRAGISPPGAASAAEEHRTTVPADA